MGSGILSFGKAKESEKAGVCEDCRAKELEKKDSKAAKRRDKKLKKAWLYGGR